MVPMGHFARWPRSQGTSRRETLLQSKIQFLADEVVRMAAVMTGESAKVQRTYLTLMLFTTLSASLIWGINTLFLLDAGLNNLEAFAANAFFTAGMMVFEVPTGVVADLRGRRLSFLLGSATLTAVDAAYVLMWQLEAPFWAWAVGRC